MPARQSVFVDNTPGGVSVFPDSPGGSQIGPFRVNATTLYIVAQGDSNFSTDIAVYKSTDNGATWQGPLDTAHATTISGGAGNWSAVLSGGILFIVFYNVVGTNNVAIFRFNTATDLYINPAFVNVVLGTSNTNGAVGTYKEATFKPGTIQVRSDGSFVVTLNELENVAAVNHARTRFDVFSAAGATIAADVLCGKNGLAVDDLHAGSILGANDRVHVFYLDYSTKTLCHRTVTSANAVQAEQVITGAVFDPGGLNTQSLLESIGGVAFNAATGEIAIPYKDATNHLRIARATSADVPVWTTEQVDTTIPLLVHGQNTGAQVSCAYYDDSGVLNVAFFDNQTPPTILNLYLVSKAGGAWNAPVLWFPSGIPSGGGINIQTIHVENVGLLGAILFTPDNTGANYILSFLNLAPAISGVAFVNVLALNVVKLPWDKHRPNHTEGKHYFK